MKALRNIRFILYALSFTGLMGYMIKGVMPMLWFAVLFILFAGVLKEVKK